MNWTDWATTALSAANTTRAARPPTALAGSSVTPGHGRDAGAGLHRRRLHRRVGPRQYADKVRAAHRADHRRAVGSPGAARSRRRGGVAEEPIHRGDRGGSKIPRRGKMAARAGRVACAVQDLLDL